MNLKKKNWIFLLLLASGSLSSIRVVATDIEDGRVQDRPTIQEIIVEGNKYVKKDAILRKVPYKVGDQFDKEKTSMTINLLYALGYFRQVRIETEKLEDNKIKLFVVVEERKLLERVSLEGNVAIKSKKIISKLNLDKVETIDEEQIKRMALAIEKFYKDESFHSVKVDYKIVDDKLNPDKSRVVFVIDEGKKARIKRIIFRGNKLIPDRKLRTVIFTREDWIMGLLDESGKYNEESLEMDKKRIEYVYREHGYLMAKVAGVDIEFSKNNKEITVTFDIREGNQFTIRYVSVPGDDLFEEDELLEHVFVESGKPFSQSKIVKSIERLKTQWGEIGYIYADVYPQVVPNEETNEVDITFHAEKGKRMFVNRINITGNKITKDRVIRRELEIEEGDLITSKKLGNSKNSVEYLGFFERGAVNWKMHKVSEDTVDLELALREAKTGKLNAGLSYGSDKGTSNRSVRGNVSLEKSNFLGRGFDIGLGLQSSLHRFQSGSIHFFDPHLFDTDVSTAVSLYVQQEEYEQWGNLSPSPLQRVYGTSANFGFLLPKFSRRTRVGLEAGFEHIKNNNPQTTPGEKATLQPIVDRIFQAGNHFWLGADISKDIRNHRVYPNRGYKILLGLKTAPPGLNQEFSFFKAELDWSWYTPLIGEQDLVLMLHARAGIIDTISKNKVIPYKELFHMGGQTTVRGFIWGGIEPAWINASHGNPLGARKAIQFNMELVFPLVPDYKMKAHVFYDAGAGWDTPKQCIPNRSFVKRDKFNLRHSVGFGLNLSNPFPAKIDWGYKLDRDKAAGESPHEFHISMNSAW